MIALYYGHCEDCGGKITPGELIRLADHDGERFYSHVECPDDPVVDLRPGETVCETCFLVKPCECDS